MTQAHTCPPHEQLIRLAGGTASRQEAEAFATHLEQCAGCAERLDQIDAGGKIVQLLQHPGVRAATVADTGIQAVMDQLVLLPDELTEMEGFSGSESSALPEPLPARLGRYRIEHEVARGGMGRVVRVHDELFDRPLAMKIMLEKGARAGALRERFRREARLTGHLQHPGVPPVQELGELPDGRPYFIMKLIQGKSLSELLEKRTTVDEDRPMLLNIFEQVCQTLGYAHSRSIIHRDLKPDNIMVGAFGEVQVMDWGLAKETSDGRSQITDCRLPTSDDAHAECLDQSGVENPKSKIQNPKSTIAGSVLGTPAYMAPEQARGDIEELGPRADVFGLGGILCAILTGKPPFAEGSNEDRRRRANSGDLSAAFDRLDRCGADAELIQLAKSLLAVDPQDRPENAGVVAELVARYQADVQRRLKQAEIDHAAAEARAAQEARIRREAEKRNRLAVALLTVIVTVSVALAALTFFLLRANEGERTAKLAAIEAKGMADKAQTIAEEKQKQAERDREDARQKGKTAEEITEFLIGLFQASDPTGLTGFGFRSAQQKGADLKARDLLVFGTRKVQEQLKTEPIIKAALLDQLGNIHRSLGLFKQAQPLLEEALSLRKENLGMDHEDTATSLFHLGWLYHDQGKFPEAVDLYRNALAIREKHFGKDSLPVAQVKFNLAWALSFQFQSLAPDKAREAETLFREVVTIRKEKLGETHRDVGLAMAALATLLLGQNDVEALIVAAQAFAILEAADNKDKVSTGLIDYWKAREERQKKNYVEADKLYKKVLQTGKEVLGEEHPLYGLLLGDYAGMLRDKGDPVAAEAAICKALDIGRKSPLQGHPGMIDALLKYGDHLRDHGNQQKAEQLYHEALDIAAKFGRSNLADTARQRLIDLLNSQNRHEEAEKLKKAAPAKKPGP